MSIVRAFGFYTGHAARLGVFFGAALCLGRFLLARFDLDSTVAKFALFTILGLGAMGTVFFLLGALHLFDRPEVIAVLVACYAPAWRSRRRALPALRRAYQTLRTSRGRLLVGLGIAVVTTLVVSALYPPLDSDSTMYHLPVARAFASAHALPALPTLRYPVFPQFHELLAAAALLVGDDVLAQLINVLWCLLIVATLFAWSERLGDRRLGLWSAVLWLGSPLVWLLARTTFVELAVVAFATAAALAVDFGLDSGKARWFALAGTLAGCAAATKYTGLYFVVALGAVALIGRRGTRARSLGAFALCAAATAGPWYARTFLLSGDPVWPFLGEVFGYRFWTQTDLASAVWTLRNEGVPRTLRGFLSLPWRLSWHQPERPWLSPALLTLFPLAVLGLPRKNGNRWLFAVAVGFVVFWFFTTQQIRFFLPIVPLVALLGVQAAFRILDRLFEEKNAVAWRAIAVLLLAGLLMPSVAELARAGARRGFPPTDPSSRARFLARRLPSYDVYQRLNREFGSTYTIYALYDERMKYYCDGTQLGDWFGYASYGHVDLTDGEKLLAGLRRFGADYFLVNEAFHPVRLPDDAFFRAHFERIFAGDKVTAFRIAEDFAMKSGAPPNPALRR